MFVDSKYDSSQHILCLYWLKVFAVKFVSQGWVRSSSCPSSKKCMYCRLTFVNPADCKTHKKKDHVANQKGIDSSRSLFGQDMMIKVPKSGLSGKQAVKSLNAPAVSKVLHLGGTRFPYTIHYTSCVECKMIMGTPDHFRKHIECSMCRFASSCSIAYANHMMGFHSSKMTSLNLSIPWERPMREPMHCLCGFKSRYGNKIANHLVYCMKRSCYSTKPAAVVREVEAHKDEDPRHLGLAKKKNVTTIDEGAESVDDDSSNDSYHDPASEEEDGIKQESELMDCSPQNGDSTNGKGDNLFPLSTSECVDPGGDQLSQETPVVKQEPTDNGEYENSVTQSVETTHTKTVLYDHTQLSSCDAVSHPIMSDTKVGVVKQEPTEKGEYESSATQSVETTQSKTVYHCTQLTSSGATSHPVMSDTNVGVVKLEPTGKGENSVTKSAATSERIVPQQVIRRGNSLFLESASASTGTPNLQNPISRGQQISTSSEFPSVSDPITTAVKQETPSTNTHTCSHNRGVNDKQTDEGCKQMDEKMFNQNKKLQKHMGTQTSEEPYKCDVCGKEFNQRGNLQRHMRIHTGEKPYKCDVCGKAFTEKGHLQRHKRIHTGDKPYKCDVCGKAYSDGGHFQRHMRMHTGEKPPRCDVCGMEFSLTVRLKRHMRIHTGGKPYKCDVCGKAFSQKGSLQTHMRMHTGEKPYKCDVCGKALSRTGSLRRHMMIHTGKKPFKCDVCGKAFRCTVTLKDHKMTHTGRKPYKCDVCGKAFILSGNLQRHRRVHTGERPYKCDVCGKAYTTNGCLKAHIRTHTGERPYKCYICGKAFMHNEDLQKHMRTHTGEKPYKCDVCGNAFSQSGSLQTHMRTHTGDY